MNSKYGVSDKSIIFNFSQKYCKTITEVLSSEAFKKVWAGYLRHIEKSGNEPFLKLVSKTKDPLNDFVRLFKLLSLFEVEEIIKSNNYVDVLLEREELYHLVENFYEYWRHLERYAVMKSRANRESLECVNFIDATTEFNLLILKVYRTISQKLYGTNFHIYRQLSAGVNASILVCQNEWAKKGSVYEKLNDVNFIDSVVINPPFITYSKKNTRKGIFPEVFKNPIEEVNLNSEDWFCYPAMIGSSLAYVYFHRDYLHHGMGLCNLFDFVHMDKCQNKKPDLICVFGAKIEGECKFYHDKEEDIHIGILPYGDEIDYFGYMKKMLLTIHNIKMIDQGYLPIHGAGVNIELKNGVKKTVVLIGDSGAGKSESLEALKQLASSDIVSMTTVFDDMGTFKLKDGKVYAYGTEIGAFVRLDDLENGYAYKAMERAIFMNPDKVNSRLVMPVSTYPEIMKGYPVDMVFYANNYSEDENTLNIFNNVSDAIEVFKKGARVAKGTTSEKGLVTSYFANPFGPVQHQEKCSKLLDLYFNTLFKEGIPVGEIHTRLAVPGFEHEGPKGVAKFLYELIKKEEK